MVTTSWAGDLAYQNKPEIQLRDSTGLTPVSPLSFPIRGNSTQKDYSNVNSFYANLQRASNVLFLRIHQDGFDLAQLVAAEFQIFQRADAVIDLLNAAGADHG